MLSDERAFWSLKRRFITEIFDEFPSGRQAGALARSIQSNVVDMNKHELSFLFEIIQNANDYPDGSKPVYLGIDINETRMVIQHNGTPFEDDHVDSLCNVGKSTKAKGADKIGYKGIGFKSIFSISEYVHLQSGGFSFRFDKSHHEEPVAWQVAPIWTETSHDSDNLPNVHIECRLTQGKQFSERILEKFQAQEFNESFILFLPKVEEVNVRVHGEEFRFKSDRNSTASDWAFFDTEKIAIPDEIKRQLEKNDIVPDKLKESTSTTLQFAARHNSDENFKGKIFVFLPTRLTTGLPFHLNGDFIPDVSRHELNEDLEWNSFLIRQAGIHLIHEIGAEKPSELEQANGFNFVPNPTEIKMGPWQAPFIEGIREGLNTVSVIPCTDNLIHQICEVTLDCIGVGDLMGETLLREALEIEGPIALPNERILTGANRLDKFLDDGDGARFIVWDDLEDAWSSDACRRWLLDVNNCQKTIEFLYQHDQLNGKCLVIPNEQGEFRSIEETYTDFPGDAQLAHCLDIHIAKEGVFDDVEKLPHPQSFSTRNFIDNILEDSKKIKEVQTRFKQRDNPNGLLHFLHRNQEMLSPANYVRIYELCGIMDGSYTWHDRIDAIKDAFLINPLLEPISELNDHFAFSLIGGPQKTNEKDAEHASWLGFLMQAKVPQMNALEFYKNWLGPLLEDTAHSDHPWHSQEVQNIVWTYLCAGWNQLDSDQKSELKKLTKKTPVITSNGTLEELKHCSPGVESALVATVNAFNLRHHFLQSGYSKALQEQLSRLGLKEDESDLIEPILERIPELEGDNLIRATQFLFQFRGRKKLNLDNLNFKFRLIDSEGTDRLASDCLLPKQLETESQKLGLPSPTNYHVSSQYLTGEEDDEWRSFFERLGLIQSEKNIFRIKALGWAQAEIKNPLNSENRKDIWHLLAQEHATRKLPEDVLIGLRGIQLHTVDIHGKSTLEDAEQCFFGSNLSDEFDLQNLAYGSDHVHLRFVSELVEKTDATRALFIELGVQDALQPIKRKTVIPLHQLPNDYLSEIRKNNAGVPEESKGHDELHLEVCLPGIELLDTPNIAKAFWEGPCTHYRFWELVQKKSVYHQVGIEEPQTSKVPSFIFWRLNHQSFIPTQKEVMVPASAIPAPKLKHLLPDAPIPALDMEMDIAGTPLWKRLDCKNQLTLDECLGAIRHGKWRSKKPVLATQLTQAIQDLDNTTLQEALSTHLEDVSWGWPNQMGAFKPANQLAVMNGITQTAHHRHILLHLSLKGIADRIHVRTLTKEDVQTTTIAKEREVNAKPLLLRRLSALAQVLHDNNAEDIESRWRERLDPMKFTGVDLIRQKIRLLEFTSDHLLDHTEGNHFYYLRPFSSMKGAELLKKLMSKDVLDIDEKDKWAVADALTLRDGSEWDKWLIHHGLKEREPLKEETPDETESPMTEEPSEKLEKQQAEAIQNEEGAETIDTQPEKGKKWYDHLEEIDLERIRGLFGNELDQDEQTNLMIEAMFRGLRFYEQAGWTLAGGNESGQFKSAIHSREPLKFINGDGESLHVLCRSAKRGLLWLHEFPWKKIEDEVEPCDLFVVTGGGSGEHRQFKSRAELIACHSSILGHDEVLLKLGPPKESVDSSLAKTELESAANGLVLYSQSPRELHFIFLIKDKEKMDDDTLIMLRQILEFHEEE